MPRGIRQELAEHFCLTVSAIDYRLKHGHAETCRKAREIAQRQAAEKLRKQRRVAGKKQDLRSFKRSLRRISNNEPLETGQQDFLDNLGASNA